MRSGLQYIIIVFLRQLSFVWSRADGHTSQAISTYRDINCSFWCPQNPVLTFQRFLARTDVWLKLQFVKWIWFSRFETEFRVKTKRRFVKCSQNPRLDKHRLLNSILSSAYLYIKWMCEHNTKNRVPDISVALQMYHNLKPGNNWFVKRSVQLTQS